MVQGKKYVARYVKSLDELNDCKNDIIQVHPDKTKFMWVECAYSKGENKTIIVEKVTEHFIPLYPKKGYLTFVEKKY
jgi:hypothetical protein